MRGQAERDEQTLVIGGLLGVLVAVGLVTTLGAVVASTVLDVAVGRAGLLVGVVALITGGWTLVSFAVRRD